MESMKFFLVLMTPFVMRVVLALIDYPTEYFMLTYDVCIHVDIFQFLDSIASLALGHDCESLTSSQSL